MIGLEPYAEVIRDQYLKYKKAQLTVNILWNTIDVCNLAEDLTCYWKSNRLIDSSRRRGRLLYLILWTETGICRYGCKRKQFRQNTRKVDRSLVSYVGNDQVYGHIRRRTALIYCLMFILMINFSSWYRSPWNSRESHCQSSGFAALIIVPQIA